MYFFEMKWRCFSIISISDFVFVTYAVTSQLWTYIYLYLFFFIFYCLLVVDFFMLNLSAICMHLCKSPLTKISTAIQATDRPSVRPSDQQRIFSSGHKEVRVKEHHHRLKFQQQQKASIYCLRVIKISTVSFLFFFIFLLHLSFFCCDCLPLIAAGFLNWFLVVTMVLSCLDWVQCETKDNYATLRRYFSDGAPASKLRYSPHLCRSDHQEGKRNRNYRANIYGSYIWVHVRISISDLKASYEIFSGLRIDRVIEFN